MEGKKVEFLIEKKYQPGTVICFRFGSLEHCNCKDEERTSFDDAWYAKIWMRQNGLSEKEYFVAEHEL